jgi:ABC-2 type transport system permease protein
MKGMMPVLRREYLERVRTRVFVLSTLGLPLFMALIFAVPMMMGARDGQRDREIALLDRTGVLASPLAAALEAGGYTPQVIPDAPDALSSLDASLEEGRYGGALVLDRETLRTGAAEYRGRRTPGVATTLALQGAVARTALQVRMQSEGMPEGLDSLLRGGSLEVVRVGVETDEDGAIDAQAGANAGFFGAFLLYMVLILYGTAVMRSVLEEKSGRMVEIVLSALRPRDLLLGKILGVGAVGLTQIVAWVVIGTLAVRLLPQRFTGGLAGVGGGIQSFLPSSGIVALLVAFFVLGYLLYASLYAAAGAVCSREEEVQQAQFPVTLILIIPVILLPGVMNDPDWGVGKALALVPFFAPVLQFARAAAGAAEGWEVALSLGLMAVSIPLVAALAGRIYRVGILMQGKRPSLGEIWRMARTG